MKAAYIAYDMSALRTSDYLTQEFDQIDYYLIDRSQHSIVSDFNQIPILVDSYCLPFEETLRTDVHRHILKDIQSEYKDLRSHFLGDISKTKNSVSLTSSKQGKISIYSLSEVKDIFFNSKNCEVFLEKEKTGLLSYQFLLIERSQLMADQLPFDKKNLFHETPEQSHVWFRSEFSYELTKPRSYLSDRVNCFLIHDQEYKSILDNWYYLHLTPEAISVQQWIPYHQHKNSEFQKFIIERTRKKVQEKLDFIHFKDLLRADVNTACGFVVRAGEMQHPKQSVIMPSFHFWTDEQINQKIDFEISQKIKKLQKQLLKIEQQKNRAAKDI